MPFARQAVPQPLRKQARPKPFPAPTAGWVSATNRAMAPANSALILENWYPTTTGIKMRSGSQKHATVSESGEPCESLMAYVGLSTRELFGAADGNIFDLTIVADVDAEPTASVTGQTSNYYSHVNIANAGGYYMHCANGTDPMLVYDGTNFLPVFDTALYALNYDAETAAFTAGQTLTGGTSGHTGVIVKVIDNGTTGTLWLRATTGTFQNNETITDGAGGSATADGVRSLLIAALTGVATDEIDHVNVYKNRLWLTNRTTNAYALATDAITGATAYTIALAGVYRRGGYIMATASWSFDAGNGPAEVIAFISSEGEIAVYQGDPSETTWGIIGLYDCSPMLGKNAFLKVAGDILLVTEIGLVPLSQVKNKDPAALAIAAISRNIQPDWQAEAAARCSLPWEIVKWASRNIAYVTCPVAGDESVTPPICFAVNLETGAWCKVTGWNTRCMILHDDLVYFGTNGGTVMQADITGADDGELIYYAYLGNADHLGALGQYKTVTQARAVFRARAEFNPLIDTLTDYETTLPTYPSAATITSVSSDWDVGLWDVAQWDAATETFTVQTYWVSVGKSGFAHAPCILVTSGSAAAPSAELVVFETLHEGGGWAV